MPTSPKKLKRPWITGPPKTNKSWAINEYDYHSKQWRELESSHKKAFPLCAECLKQKVMTPVYATDHIKAIEDGGDPDDWNNLQSLCKSHHSSKTSTERHNRKKHS